MPETLRPDTGELTTDDPALAQSIRLMAAEGRELEALGVFYVVSPCACGTYSQGARDGWCVQYVAGVQLDVCNDCGRPSNRERLLPGPPFAKGDMVVYLGLLWVLVGSPGPTGVVRAYAYGDDPSETLTLHVLQLNRED